MSLEEQLVSRIGQVAKNRVLDNALKTDLLRILSKDNEKMLNNEVHCLVWKKKDVVVPSNFEYLSGNLYLADITYQEIVDLVEKNDYVSIEKTRVHLSPFPMPELYTPQ